MAIEKFQPLMTDNEKMNINLQRLQVILAQISQAISSLEKKTQGDTNGNN